MLGHIGNGNPLTTVDCLLGVHLDGEAVSEAPPALYVDEDDAILIFIEGDDVARTCEAVPVLLEDFVAATLEVEGRGVLALKLKRSSGGLGLVHVGSFLVVFLSDMIIIKLIKMG